MNFKNISENLIYIIVTNVVTAIIVFNLTIKATNKTINLFIPSIEESFRKETTSIINEYETNIKKQKVKRGTAVIDYTPKVINNIEKEQIIQYKDTIKDTIKEKRGFFKRLFNKK